MVISLAIAQKEKEYSKKKMPTFQAAGRIVNAFEEQAGNTECRALCGLDLTTAEGRKKLEGGVKEQICAKLSSWVRNYWLKNYKSFDFLFFGNYMLISLYGAAIRWAGCGGTDIILYYLF